LDEEQFAAIIRHGRADRDLGRLVTRDAFADFLHPFRDVPVGVEDTV